LFNTKQ